MIYIACTHISTLLLFLNVIINIIISPDVKLNVQNYQSCSHKLTARYNVQNKAH